MVAIKLEKITKIFGTEENTVTAVKDCSINIHSGEFAGIMGRSGSGKSTLLSILGVLSPPTTGNIHIDGIDVYRLSNERQAEFRREYIGFVFQQFQLIPYLTALENVMLPLTIAKLPRNKKKELAKSVLTRLGLEKKENHLPSQMSGGEQGRVAIARAIVNSPPVILADEPTGSLDTNTGKEIMELFQELNEEGHTIIMVTHNKENLDYTGKVIELKDGKIIRNTFTNVIKN